MFGGSIIGIRSSGRHAVPALSNIYTTTNHVLWVEQVPNGSSGGISVVWSNIETRSVVTPV